MRADGRSSFDELYAANIREATHRMVATSSSQIILSSVLSRTGLLNVTLKPTKPKIDRSNTAHSAYGTEK